MKSELYVDGEKGNLKPEMLKKIIGPIYLEFDVPSASVIYNN